MQNPGLVSSPDRTFMSLRFSADRRRICALGVQALGLLSWRAALAESEVGPREIVIGQSISLDGGKNGYAKAALQSMQVVLDQVNARGGVHGRRIVLNTLDDHDIASEADANARKLIDEGAFLLFGSMEGGPSSAIAKVAKERSVPFIGPMSGSPALWRPHNPWVFPVRAEHRTEFQSLLAWASQTGLKTIGMLRADTPVGEQHLSNLKALGATLNMEFVLDMPFKGNPSDEQLNQMVVSLAKARPDVVVNHGAASLYARLIKSAKAQGIKSTFMGVNSGSSQIAAALGEDAKGMVFSQVVPSPWERKHLVSREYQDAMRAVTPDLDPRTALSYGGLEGYLTARLLVHALTLAGAAPTRAALMTALESKPHEVCGLTIRYTPTAHLGMNFVDLSMVAKNGNFIH